MISRSKNSEPGLLIVGDYLFDPKNGLLSGPSGAHHMCTRMADLLSRLIDTSNEVVDRESLIRNFWPDDDNGSTALNQSVGRLRHFFGDTARASNYIETVPNRGYRLVAPVYGSARKPETIPVSRTKAVNTGGGNQLSCLIREFRERKVCRSMLIYTIVIWVVFQVSEIIVPALGLPAWVNSLVVVLGILGFPVAAALSWIFDLTPDGLVREYAHADNVAGGPSRTVTDLVFDSVLMVAALAISGMLVVSSLGYGSDSLTDTAGGGSPDTESAAPSPTIAIRNFSVDGSDMLVSEISADVTAEILSTLIQHSEFNIVAGRALDATHSNQILESHGADTVLEGSIDRDGADIRVNVYLLDAHSRTNVWSQVVERPLPARKDLAYEVSSSVLRALRVLESQQDGDSTQPFPAVEADTHRLSQN